MCAPLCHSFCLILCCVRGRQWEAQTPLNIKQSKNCLDVYAHCGGSTSSETWYSPEQCKCFKSARAAAVEQITVNGLKTSVVCDSIIKIFCSHATWSGRFQLSTTSSFLLAFVFHLFSPFLNLSPLSPPLWIFFLPIAFDNLLLGITAAVLLL